MSVVSLNNIGHITHLFKVLFKINDNDILFRFYYDNLTDKRGGFKTSTTSALALKGILEPFQSKKKNFLSFTILNFDKSCITFFFLLILISSVETLLELS